MRNDKFVVLVNKKRAFVFRNLLMEGRLHLVLEGQEFRDVFSGRLKGSVLTETLYYQHILKYIYLLPKIKGPVERVEDYPFSGPHEGFPLDI